MALRLHLQWLLTLAGFHLRFDVYVDSVSIWFAMKSYDRLHFSRWLWPQDPQLHIV
jgi:hypothetical protein